jgi:hypothetical protein
MSISLATGCMKLLNGPLYTWFDHTRTPANTSIFFFLFGALLAVALAYLAVGRCPQCKSHWLRGDDVAHEYERYTPDDKQLHRGAVDTDSVSEHG